MKKSYFYAKRLNYLFWSRVSRSTAVAEESLGLFRWIFGIFLLLFSVPQFSWISQAPQAFFNPPYLSFANLFSQFPGDLFFYIIDILIVISIFLITLGIRARWFGWLLLACWFLGNNFRFSFGKIDHSDIMLFALLLCMSFSNWGNYYALIPDRNSHNASKKALALLSVLLAFAMFTAGFEKAFIWIDFNFNTNGFLSWFYPGYYDINHTELLAPLVLKLPKWIFEFADYGAVVFEVSGFIALLSSRKWWLCWLLVGCLFHLSNILLLNIPFNNHFVVYLAFVDFSQIRQWLWRGKASIGKQLKFFLSGLVFVLVIAHIIPRIYRQNFEPFSAIELYDGIAIWILGAIVIATNLLIADSKSAV